MTTGRSAQGALNAVYDAANHALTIKRVAVASAWVPHGSHEMQGVWSDVVDSDGTLRVVEVG